MAIISAVLPFLMLLSSSATAVSNVHGIPAVVGYIAVVGFILRLYITANGAHWRIFIALNISTPSTSIYFLLRELKINKMFNLITKTVLLYSC